MRYFVEISLIELVAVVLSFLRIDYRRIGISVSTVVLKIRYGALRVVIGVVLFCSRIRWCCFWGNVVKLGVKCVS